MSAFPVALGRLGGKPAKGKAKKKAKKRSRAQAVCAEYNMLLTATLCLLALGAVMVFSASSTTRILQDGGLSDSAFYLKRTLMFGAVGLVIMHLTARHGLQAVRNLTPAILGGSLLPAARRARRSAPPSTAPAAGSAPASCRSSPRRSPRWRWSSTAPTCSPASRSGRARSKGFMPFLLVVGAGLRC